MEECFEVSVSPIITNLGLRHGKARTSINKTVREREKERQFSYII